MSFFRWLKKKLEDVKEEVREPSSYEAGNVMICGIALDCLRITRSSDISICMEFIGSREALEAIKLLLPEFGQSELLPIRGLPKFERLFRSALHYVKSYPTAVLPDGHWMSLFGVRVRETQIREWGDAYRLLFYVNEHLGTSGLPFWTVIRGGYEHR